MLKITTFLALGAVVIYASSIEYGIELFNKKRFRKSFEILMPYAREGDAKAEFFIGLIYDMGDISIMDKAKAVKWYRKSAEKGFLRAQYDMGVMLSKGEGIEKDLKEAIIWYQKSAKGGYPYSMYNLGVAYHRGYGLEQNLTLAKKWYKKALEHNIAKAGANLASIEFNKGEYKDAFTLYKRASQLGDPKAMYYLALMYERGLGVDRDTQRAKEWYKISAIRGYRKSAIKYVEFLELEKNYKELKFWRSILSKW